MSQLLPADFFLLRTPTLPWDVIGDWCDGLEAKSSSASGSDLEAALARDTGALRVRLREIVRRPEVLAALRIASPSLCARLPAWLDGDEREAALSVESALVRYVMRMAGRATPFGLFAGTTLGSPADRTNLRVPQTAMHRRLTRLSLDYLVALACRLSANETLRPHIRFRANETVYEAAGRHRFYALRIGAKNNRTYHLCDIAASPYADVVLSAARRNDGAPMSQLADALVAAGNGLGHGEALEYVASLVRIGMLWSTLIPAVTGEDPLPQLIERLRGMPTGGSLADALQSVRDDVTLLDAAPFAVHEEVHKRIERTLHELGTEIESNQVLRVDLRKPCEGVTLSRTILAEIASSAELLIGLSMRRETPIEVFAREFEERYQERELPLLEVLDAESGIGFELARGVDASPLIKDLKTEPGEAPGISWGGRSRLLLEKLTAALSAGATEIQLSAKDITTLTNAKALPPATGQTAIVTVVASSEAALAEGRHRLLMMGVSGTSAGTLLGRFLHDDCEMAVHARAALRKEEAHDPDALHAEIAHHTQGYATNVNCRPLLRDYEIDVAVGSGAPASQRIPLSDLLVSVRNGKVQLRSKAHGKRVVPHLSSAHAYEIPGLPAYRFLTQLQEQGVSCNHAWWWGPALSDAPFLPRVTHGHVVLSLARWKIPGERLDAIHALRGPARFEAVQALRSDHKLPRFVRLVENNHTDNQLVVDLENVLSIESMLGSCKRLPSVILTEEFPEADELVARGPEGAFRHELLVPLLRASSAAPAPSITALRSISPRPDLARRPGDDWLFLKLHCGVATFDRLLVELVAPLIGRLRADHAIDKWFFIRYNLSGWHMRLRLHGEAKALWTEVAPRVLEATSSVRELVHTVSIDTYDPEVERYGGPEALAIAEEVFDADSDAALAIVERCRGNSEARWRIALAGMNAMLDDFGFSVAEKKDIALLARDGQAGNVRPGPELTRQLGDKFRVLRTEVDELIVGMPAKYSAGAEAIARRSVALGRLAPRLRELELRGRLTASPSFIVTNYLHMWANRVFRGSPNLHEYVLYDFLHRAYKGVLARAGSEHPARNAPRKAGVR
jgi:thiopeptide-type bacteriocin biosynthesis protein